LSRRISRFYLGISISKNNTQPHKDSHKEYSFHGYYYNTILGFIFYLSAAESSIPVFPIRPGIAAVPCLNWIGKHAVFYGKAAYAAEAAYLLSD
jgi:hypothetical protein